MGHDVVMRKGAALKRRVREINEQRQELNGRIRSLARKSREGAITTQENEELIRLRHRHRDLGRKLAAITTDREFDPFSLSRSRAEGPRGPQGPAGGVRSVVQGGAPGSGKRA